MRQQAGTSLDEASAGRHTSLHAACKIGVHLRGDAFNAGFAAALTEGQNIKDALKFASATAGLSTTKIGTANSMPSREEIDKLL